MLHANEHMNAYEALLYVQKSKYNFALPLLRDSG